MKIIKRTILTILILIAVGALFRGWIYRFVVTYKSEGIRNSYVVPNKQFSDYIDKGTQKLITPNIDQIVSHSLVLTSNQLNFSARKNEIEPNKLMTTKTTHCVGYSSFFAASCNHLLKKYNMEDIWVVNQHIGQLYFLGKNIHKYLNSPFFKDHDFVTIENKLTGELIAVDPSLYDYLYIDCVNYSK
jgi:hypothetical protein